MTNVSPTLPCKIQFSDYDLIRKGSQEPRSAAQESIPSIKAQKAHGRLRRSHRRPHFPLPAVCLCRRDTHPCRLSEALRLSGTSHSRLMSLLCNQGLLFEAACPWCLMHFEWIFSWISGLFVCFLMHWDVLQNINYKKNMNISPLRCQSWYQRTNFIITALRRFFLCENTFTQL